MHSFWVLFKQLCRAGRLAPDSRLLQVCASTAATIGALSYFSNVLSSCRNKITIVSVAKDIGSLCTARGDSGRRWRGGRGPQGGEKCRIDQPYKILFHWQFVYLLGDNNNLGLSLSVKWLRTVLYKWSAKGYVLFHGSIFRFFLFCQKASQVLFAVFGNVLRRMVISQRGRYPILCGLHGRFLVLEIPIIARLYKIWWWANPLPNLSTILGAARGK